MKNKPFPALAKRLSVGTVLIAGGAAMLAFPTGGAAQNSVQAPVTAPANKPDLSILHAQVILDHLGFAPGPLDGKGGAPFTAAVKAFQRSRGVAVTGRVDADTLRALYPYRALRPVRKLLLTPNAVRGPFVKDLPATAEAQAKLGALGYRSVVEKLAEMFHTTPQTLAALNASGAPLVANVEMVFPNALPTSREYPKDLPAGWRRTLHDLNVDAVQPDVARIVVDRSDNAVRLYDASDRMVGQLYASVGSAQEPMPTGRFTIGETLYNPVFRYDATRFWPEAEATDAIALPPGPNSPAGVVRIGLVGVEYGFHGVPEPAQVGQPVKRGQIGLTNWDAARLALVVKPGMPVLLQE